MTTETLSSKRVLRRAAVLERTGLGTTALDDAIARGEFPAPFPITDSGRAVAWLESEIDDWLAARLRKRAEAQAKRKAEREAPTPSNAPTKRKARAR